ncbi:hypothetical protein WME75_34205 [Sorangium sp. So ce1014]|uniref:hypothetical protein n=1 Tax=Sorangium sp. So ce1014 TaxID=3133326 RepID=UPI003F5E09D2
MRGVPIAVVILLSAAVAACDPTAPPSDTPRDPAAPQPLSVAVAPVISAVTWPPPASVDRSALAALPTTAAHAARTSQVPVLVPSRRALLAAPVIVAKEHWTSFWARTESITVSLAMTRLARKVPGIPPLQGAHSVRGAPAFITANEGIWTASWLENGVSYALDVECASPEAPPCASDALLRELASELVYVGGVGAKAAGDRP